jgi:UDP-N-acetylmuramoyl-L-alanyl-D-glutamate--2,6-diaminopimelate ligase
VQDARLALAYASANFYHHPSKKMMLIGVTGTDGKTTTCHLIHSIISHYGSAGLMGTVGNIILGREQKAVRTTPEALELNQDLDRLLQGGAHAAVIEVSSHALALHRTDLLDFDIAVFTNLGQDHLDFHLDMESYFKAKARLFLDMKPEGCCILNIDDPMGVRLREKVGSSVVSYSLKDKSADVYGELILVGIDGIRMNIGYDNCLIDISSPLFGIPNAYNILAAVATALRTNCTIPIIKRTLKEFSGVKGRFQKIDCGKFTVIIDYAHTPQAISNLLKTLRPLTKGRLHILFGCGGNRDKEKRPLMGANAETEADVVYITTDNPRWEAPQEIIKQIISGMKNPAQANVIPDRTEAIITALDAANEGDVIAIAGKGHEDYQEILGVFHHFDDREVVEQWIKKSIS